jgi:tRNA dimethylallyltransferase
MKNKLIVVAGPTATGKSDLGIKLAHQFNGEIISADSRQVYKGMDLGTGKVKTEPTEKTNDLEKKLGQCLSGNVVHYLLDVADPKKEIFNMAKFQNLAYQAIDLILSKDKLPFLVGGTMLYIDAVVEGFSSVGKKDESLRKDLQSKSLSDLKEILKKIDQRSFNRLDINNKYRLIRAIETKRLTGKSFLDAKTKSAPNFDYLKLVLNPFSREKLYQQIDKRVDIRLEEGMVEEIKQLHKNGLSYNRMDKLGLEYRYISRYLKGELKKDEMTKILKEKTHGYARRQLTWWRNDKEAIWIKSYDEAERRVINFIN